MNPEAALEEGRFVETVPGLATYVGRKEGTRFRDIKIYDSREHNFTRRIWAETGYLETAPEERNLLLYLQDVRVEPFSRDVQGAAFIKKWVVPLGLSRGGGQYRKKPVDFSAGELICAIRNPSDYFPQLDPRSRQVKRAQLVFDLHERLVLALACLVFTLIGFPLAVRSHRKESSIGIAMGLAMILGFHMFIVAAESLDRNLVLGPLILWTPIVLGLVIAWRLVQRIR
jgi:lipopolysaccharide export system permease protein